MIGEHLGKYEILEEVGQGGMSVVYRGHDKVLKRPVAIKVLHAHLSKRADSRQRFEREALAIAKLSHPNILQIFDFSDAGSDQSYIVTEFIQGSTLRDFLEAHPLEQPELAAIIGVKLCEALAHAHQLGIIHRDIKPENVMICQDSTLKLMDFGIAQIVDNNALTVTGTLLGSPAHMSPEMIEGKPLDFRADIFSLGTLLYYAACGELPFQGRNPPLVLKAILDGNYLDAEMVNPRVGRTFSRILDRCMAMEPDDRYSTVEELANRLRDFLAQSDIEDPDHWWQDFYHQPKATQARLERHLIPVLERRGREALKARRVAAALVSFNRVLAMEPDHEAVLKLIRRLDRRRKVYVYVGAAAMLVVASAVALWASSLFDSQEDPARKPPVAINLSQARQDATTLGTTLAQPMLPFTEGLASRVQALRRGQHEEALLEASAQVTRGQFLAQKEALKEAQAAARVRDPVRNPRVPPPDPKKVTPDPEGEAEPKETAPPEPALVLVRLKISPPDATVLIGNRRYSRAEVSNGIRLPAQRVKYQLQHDAYVDLRGVFTLHLANSDVYETTLTMKNIKPARLMVACQDDPNASVVIFDENRQQLAAGRVNQTIPIPVQDPISLKRKIGVQILPGPSGGRPTFNRMNVRAGRQERLNVSMRP